MKRFLLLMGAVLFISGTAFGQTTILLEDFEDSGVYYTTSIVEFTDAGQDYFKRTDGSDITAESFSNIQGSFYFGGQDIDGEGASLPVNLTINDINISGYTSIVLRVYLAEDATGASEHWDASDYVHITGDIDEGTSQNLIWVESSGGTNTAPGIDTDFDGVGEGTEITDTFVQFSSNISGTGSLLDINIEFNLGSGDEDIAIDNIEILGTATGLPSKIISGDAGWRLLSLPKTGGTIADISDDTAIQGVTGGDNTGAAANFILYDTDATFEQPTNVSTAWGDGLGFGVYFYNNTSAGSSTLPITLDASGSSPSGDVAVTLNPAASGYTLVGNPFASNFNLSGTNLSASGAAIQNNVHFWNDGTSSYSVQDRTTPYIISPWQGFWVQLDATGGATTLTFDKDPGEVTTSSTGTFFSKTSSNRGDINFTFSSENSFDEAIRLSFRDNATLGYDLDDAGKLTPLLAAYATMAFKSNDLLKSVESLPWDLTEEITIPMEESLVGISGGFTLTWKGLESIPSNLDLTFHDYETGSNVNMREMTEYKFDAASSANEKVSPLNLLTGPAATPLKSKSEGTRFGITITPTTSVHSELEDKVSGFALDQNYPNPFNPTTTIYYSLENSGVVTLSVYNLMGQLVAELVNETKSAGIYNVTWNASQAASGMYYYRLEAGGQVLTRKMTLIK